jgi:hypothetical protein
VTVSFSRKTLLHAVTFRFLQSVIQFVSNVYKNVFSLSAGAFNGINCRMGREEELDAAPPGIGKLRGIAHPSWVHGPM